MVSASSVRVEGLTYIVRIHADLYLFAISAVPLCSLENRTLALSKQDISQIELLESRTLSGNTLLDIVNFEDKT